MVKFELLELAISLSVRSELTLFIQTEIAQRPITTGQIIIAHNLSTELHIEMFPPSLNTSNQSS